MGAGISRRIVHALNEIHVIVGCGFAGVVVSLFRRQYKSLFQVMMTFALAGAGVIYSLTPTEKKKINENNVVFITGCDSGLGYAMVKHMINTPVTIIATFLSLHSAGAIALRDLYESECKKDRCFLLEMDITNTESVENVVKSICKILLSKSSYELTAMVNNSGVMAFGEFEWQTDAIIQYQLAVNLVGTMNLTHKMLPLLRKDKTRLVTVTSHCAIESLPGLSVYGASKKALAGWMDSIRVELKQYGINAVSFIPGSFVMSSNISARQMELAKEMKLGMSQEQKQFYGDYFDRYNRFLSYMSGDKPPGALKDSKLLSVFESCLFDVNPKAVYKYEPVRYKIYYSLFQWTPYWLRDILVQKFVATPRYSEVSKAEGNE